MTGHVDAKAMELTTEIVVAFLDHGTIQPDRLPGLVAAIRRALEPSSDQKAPEGEWPRTYRNVEAEAALTHVVEPGPAVPVEASVTPDYLISLEDGTKFRSLKRHLMTKYGLNPDEYRAKWGLPDDYPMVAPNLAEKRSLAAKQAGLGVKAKKKSATAAARRTRAAVRE